MNEDQIKMANALLKALASKDGRMNTDQLNDFLIKPNGFNPAKLLLVRNMLRDQGFVKVSGPDNHWVELSIMGWGAAKNGYEKHHH